MKEHESTLPWGSEVKNCVPTYFLVSNADEQNLSWKAVVTCQDQKPSPSEKCCHKGIVES